MDKYLEIVTKEYKMKPPGGFGAALSTTVSAIPGAGSMSSFGTINTIKDVEKAARKLNANAVVGMQMHCFMYSNNLSVVNAVGTAVRIGKTERMCINVNLII